MLGDLLLSGDSLAFLFEIAQWLINVTCEQETAPACLNLRLWPVGCDPCNSVPKGMLAMICNMQQWPCASWIEAGGVASVASGWNAEMPFGSLSLLRQRKEAGCCPRMPFLVGIQDWSYSTRRDLGRTSKHVFGLLCPDVASKNVSACLL